MLNNQQKQEIIEKYQDGMSINQIAKNYKVSWDTIKRFLIGEKIYSQENKKINQYSTFSEYNLFEKIENEEQAYWLGFLYADGNIRKERNEISLDLKEEDLETIKAFHSFCNNQNKIRQHIIKKENKVFISYVSSFSSEKTKNNLIALGCVPQKSLKLTFPHESIIPDCFLLAFVKGYIDGDGSIQYDYQKYRYRITIIGTKDFLFGLQKRCQLEEHSYIYSTKCQIYNLTISGKDFVLDFLKKTYSIQTHSLERKKQIFLQALNGSSTSNC